MNAQQVVSAGLLNEGITVVYDTETPQADLRGRVMHARPLPEDVSEEDLLHLRADTDHETGHFALSDPDVLELAAERPLLALLHNAIEDGFVERWLSGRWLGVAQNLAQSNDLVVAEIKNAAKRSAASRRERSLHALQFLVLGESPERVAARFGDDIQDNLDEIASLVPMLAAVDNSAAALDAAHAVLLRWQWGNKSGSSKKQKKAAQGSAPTDSYGSDPKYRKREDRAASQIQKRASVADRRKKLIRKMTFGGAPVYYHPRTDDDVVRRLVPKKATLRAAPAFMRSVRAVAAPLRRRLLMEFRAIGNRVEHAHTSGELDRSVLHQVPLGSKTIFTREVPTVVADADVTLLVDVSGSMTELHDNVPRIVTAAQAAAAFSMVLGFLRIQHECLAFTTARRIPASVTELYYDGTYQRVRPLRHLIVKGAKQTFRQARANFVELACLSDCAENVDGEALLWAAHRLAARARPGRRPFLIVFSDGEPASVPEQHSLLAWHLKYAISRIEKAGITVLGVGIATDTVAQFYRHHLVIEELTDLVGASYALIRQALRSSLRNPAAVSGPG